MQIKAATMIMMAIMGCDDTASRCVQLEVTQPKWATVAACDKASESVLAQYSKAKYPMIVAVCQSPEAAAKADALEDAAVQQKPEINTAAPQPEQPKPNLAQKTIDLVKKAIPTTEGIKSAFQKPVHVIADGYAWVAQKFHHD